MNMSYPHFRWPFEIESISITELLSPTYPPLTQAVHFGLILSLSQLCTHHTYSCVSHLAILRLTLLLQSHSHYQLWPLTVSTVSSATVSYPHILYAAIVALATHLSFTNGVLGGTNPIG